MKYTIISRDELLKLIKFGSIYQNINNIVDKNNQEEWIKKILEESPYDDPFGYVVIEFIYEESFSISKIQTSVKLDIIKNIIKIYCLTEESLDFCKTKVDSKIKFKLYENQELIKYITSYKIIEDKKRGIEALFDIFKLEPKNIDIEYISKLLKYKENNYLEQEYKNFYFDLFCYERKNDFYKEDVGFLCDNRTILSIKDREKKEWLHNKEYTKKLRSEYDKDKNKRLIDLIKESIYKINKSDKKDIEKIEIIRNLVIGVIFLKSQKLLDTESREENYWKNFIKLINEFKEEFLEETKEALFYLGVFLGYKYLYEDYYSFKDIHAYQDNIDMDKFLSNEEKEIKNLKSEKDKLEKLKNDEIEELKDSKLDLKKELSSKDENMKNLEYEKKELEILKDKEIEKLEDSKSSFEKELLSKEKELDSLKSEKDKLENSKNNEIEKLKNSNLNFKTELSLKDENLKNLESERKELEILKDKEIEKLEDSKSSFEKELLSKEKELDSLKSEKDKLENSKNNEIEKLKNSNSNFKIELSLKNENLKNLESERKELEILKDKEIEKLEDSKSGFEKKLLSKEKELEELKSDKEELENSKNDEIEKLKNSKSGSENKLLSKEKELEELKSEKDKLEKLKNDEIEELKNSKSDSENKLLSKEKELEELKSEKDKLEKLKNDEIKDNNLSFTDNEIIEFSITHLRNVAKSRGIDKLKKYDNNPKGKIALYNEIKKHPIIGNG